MAIYSANVTVRSLILGRPLIVGDSITLRVGTAELTATITVLENATIRGGVYTIGAGGNIAFPASDLCKYARLTDVTIIGDITIASMGIRWSNVSLNGTLSIGGNGVSRITFEGDSTIAGTIACEGPSGSLVLGQITPGTLTVSPSGAIRGGGISFSSSCFTAPMALVNNGMIDASVAGRGISTPATLAVVNNGVVRTSAGTIGISGAFVNDGVIDAATGTVTIGGAFNPLIGTLTGGNFVFTGTLDLAGGTLDARGFAGRLDGGLQNGTVNTNGGSLRFLASTCGGTRLSDLTINGDLTLDGMSVRWNNIIHNGTLTASGAQSSGIFFEGDQTLSSGVVSNISSGVLTLDQFTPGTLTIAPSGSVRGGNIRFGDSCSRGPMRVVNNGTIEASTAGRSITFGAAPPLVSTVVLVCNGTMLANAGSIELRGALNAPLGTLIGAKFVVSSNGTIDLRGGTMSLAGLAMRIDGTLQNGTVNMDGGALSFPALNNCQFGRLSNLIINGGIQINAMALRWNNVVHNGTLSASGTANSVVVFEGNQTITGSVVSSVSPGQLNLSQITAGTLTIATSGSIRGGNINFGPVCNLAAASVINNGTIDANTPGRTIAFATTVVLSNNGTVNAAPGTVNIRSAFNPLGGTFSGNNAIFSGEVDLGGNTWDLAGLSYRIAGSLQNGTVHINGGNLSFPSSCVFGRLSNLIINGDFSFNGGYVRWNNVVHNGTLTVSGSIPSGIAFEGNQTISSAIVSNVVSAGLALGQATAGTLTIGAAGSIRGGNIYFVALSCQRTATGSVINNGLITADSTGQSIVIGSSTPFTNNGIINSTGGKVVFYSTPTNYSAAGSVLSGGTWRASGTGEIQLLLPTNLRVQCIAANTVVAIEGPPPKITNDGWSSVISRIDTVAGELQFVGRPYAITPASGVLTNSGTISLDRAPFTITGGYVQTSEATLSLGVGSSVLTQYGRLAVSGNAVLGGTLAAQPIGGFIPSPANVFTAVTAASILGEFTHRNGGGGYYPLTTYSPTLAQFSLLACPSITAPLSNQVACPLGTATFTSNISATTPVSYSWHRSTPGGWTPLADGPLFGVGTISGSSTADLVITRPEATGFRVRYVAVSQCGSLTSAAATLTVPPRCSVADVAGTTTNGRTCGDGTINGADFIAFINSFSTGDPTLDALADLAGAGTDGLSPDGVIDGVDFITFINTFAAGC